MKLAKKKGYTSSDECSVGDRVHVRNHISGRWDTSREITEERSSGSFSLPAPFIVKFADGNESLCHKAYLKHDITSGNERDHE